MLGTLDKSCLIKEFVRYSVVHFKLFHLFSRQKNYTEGKIYIGEGNVPPKLFGGGRGEKYMFRVFNAQN